jgi:(p)ppGpp synthase/HD superfamily hydrolase
VPDPLLGEDFRRALNLAAELHARQRRKGSDVPYIAHLLGVAAIALEHGADEEEAIAALLHDAVEDQGGPDTRERIRKEFGERVATIVDGCTDADTVPKPPWQARKEAYIEKVRHEPASIRLISASDKLHNARAILLDYLRLGEPLWERFAGGRTGTLWYYRALIEAYHAAERDPRIDPLVEELNRVVSELERLTGTPAPGVLR